MKLLNHNHSEDELFLLIREGNEAAFDVFYHRHAGLLYTQAYVILQDKAAAQDAVQEVLIYLWNHRTTVKVNTTLPIYLSGAIRQHCATVLRKEVGIRNRHQIYTDLNTSVTHNAELERKELNKRIRSAMSMITPSCRKAFEMSYIEKKTLKEIAFIMNIKVQTAKNHVQEALKVLRKNLKKS